MELLDHPIVHRLGNDTRYVLVGFPLALIGFPLMVTGLAAGAGTAVVFVGLFILSMTLLMARGFAEIERGRLREVLDRPVARAHYRKPPKGAGPIRRALNPLTCGQSWMDLLHGIVKSPLQVGAFIVTVVWWLAALHGILYPLYGWSVHRIPGYVDLSELMGFGEGLLVAIAFHFLVGVVFALTLPFVVRTCAMITASLSHGLLTPVNGLNDDEIDDAPAGRINGSGAPAVAARAAERVDAAAVPRETLAELRALSRGIAPPLLTDHGLSPALTALADRCTVPVELDIQTAERFPAEAENLAYVVVAESLINVAEHSRATKGTVTLSHTDGLLNVMVGDDGVGGAQVAKSHGLADLSERLRAVDGKLAVHSPRGGPTLIVAEVPCS
ncbi:sensor histidine kinase [Nocardiopsis gilva YIM 90087]|uniref:histidine kinase n=1 Tax=Nocardiopsis gilva YIM 90087 TaxID=1235441 RepID=A0A223S783_9ACTN|nr:sensor histidine kinase [Nocardiopsis gilva]ASU83975.1 sensor histidine kinase [Nocardiopsis gilva YIM 90087]